MSDRPTVSVLLPVYNGARYLRPAVESILAQTFADFELIAVDDGSTDRSLAMLREYARRDPRVHVISRPNTGIAGALNDALAAARGEFLARMDADDISHPERFARQLDHLRGHPDCVLLGSRVMLIDPYASPLYETDHALTHEHIEAELFEAVGWAVVHPSAMMRADPVRQVGGYRSEYVPIEDLDLFLKLTEIGRAANLPEALLQYRQHPQSANRTRYAEQEAKKRACLADAYARRGLQMPADWKPRPRIITPPVVEFRNWGWTALQRHRPDAARRHALSVVRRLPMSIDSWKLLFCALRGR